MVNTKIILDRISDLIVLADKALGSVKHSQVHGRMSHSYLDQEVFNEFRTASLSFIKMLYGENHPYYQEFNSKVAQVYPSNGEIGRGILKAIKVEVEGGWLVTMTGLISAEIFSDFLDMAEYLLAEKYKDAAAVMIGSVLEEHLRQICTKHGIAITDDNNRPKRADLLNADLARGGVYNKLDQKNVTAWLDLRNKAAHGQYAEFNQEQVENMLRAVIEFMTRNSA